MTNNTSQGAGPSHKVVESGITILIALFGVIVIIGSIQAGIDGGAEGPRAGCFPFYLGVIIVISSAINLRNEIRGGRPGLFAEWSQLRQVMRVVIPTTLYVGTMPYIGLYVGSTALIAWFMRRLGKYNWLTVAAVAIGVPVLTYIVFERWFLVPLPKGPLEEWLNL